MALPIAIIGGGPSGLTLARLLECNGVPYTVFERNTFANRISPQDGGSLDIHGATGQEALRRCGLSAEFEKLARRDAMTIQILDMHGAHHHQFGEDRDAPEIDRGQLRQLLLESIPEEKIQWDKRVASIDRDGKGDVVISFADGSVASGFRLVVGADGAWSKVRPLVTSAVPEYSGYSYIEGRISSTNPFHPTIATKVGPGTMLAFGPNKHLAAARMSDGSYRVYLGVRIPESSFAPGNSSLDLSSGDGNAAKRTFLSQDAYFKDWATELRDIIQGCEGIFRPWPLYRLPPSSLNWEPASQVTLIGDAAHVSTPFVGEGVNCAMYDSLMLTESILKHGSEDDLSGAVREYEKGMFERGKDLITRSEGSGQLLFADDAPLSLVAIIKQAEGEQQ